MSGLASSSTSIIQAIATLPIADRVRTTKNSLTISGTLSFNDWWTYYRGIEAVRGACLWWLGDLLCYGEQKYGEKYAQALEVSKHSEYEASTIRNAQWICEKVPPESRRLSLGVPRTSSLSSKKCWFSI